MIKLNPSFGGQTIIFGKSTSEIGKVSIEVSIGFSPQSMAALLMIILAVTNPHITVQIQKSLENV